MKKKSLFISCCALFSFLPQNNNNLPVGIINDNTILLANSNSVCTSGNLNVVSSKNNILPTGFYGNHPDTGVFEIGNKGGDPFAETLPTMLLGSSGRYNIFIQTKETISALSDATTLGKVGYELAFDTPDGEIKDTIISNDVRLDSFLDFVEVSGDFSSPTRGDSSLSSFLRYTASIKTYSISFNYQAGWRLKYFRLYYSNKPFNLNNVGISYQNTTLENMVNTYYNGEDCSYRNYTTNVGTNPVYRLNSQYGTVYSKDYLINSFIARDSSDGSYIRPTLEDPDNYFNEGAYASLGKEFTVYLTAEDNYGNESKITLIMTIVDTKAPTIIPINSDITVSYKTDFNSDNFLNEHFIFKDNYDFSPTFSITLENGQQVPENQIGKFECVLTAEDSSGNKARKPFTMTLIDDVAPIISTEQEDINLNVENILSEDKIISFFSAYDEIDGNIDLEVIENTYKGHEKIIGEYRVTVQAEDRSGNTSRKTIYISVKDSQGPTFYAKESFLTVTEGEIPSLEEVTESLVRQGIIPNQIYKTKEIIEGQGLTEDLPIGLHQMKLRLVSDNDEEYLINLSIKVVEKGEISSPVKMTFWQRFCQFWIDLWNKIVAFFTGEK